MLGPPETSRAHSELRTQNSGHKTQDPELRIQNSGPRTQDPERKTVPSQERLTRLEELEEKEEAYYEGLDCIAGW